MGMCPPILRMMQAIYLGDVLPIPVGSPVDVTVDGDALTITYPGHPMVLPRGELQARVVKRLSFDASHRRKGPSFFGALSMSERRGEPVLTDVAHLDTPHGPVILAMENVQEFVNALTASRHETAASVVSIGDRPLRRLIAIAILVLIALIIAVISTRPNLH